MKSISDEVHEAILEEAREFESQEILKRFFKIETDNREVAEQIVGRVLFSDTRFRKTGSGTWAAVQVMAVEDLPIHETPFLLFFCEGAEDLARETVAHGASYCFLLCRGGAGGEEVVLGDLLKHINSYVFVPYDRKSLNCLRRLYRSRSPLAAELKTLSVRTLCAALCPGVSLRTWDDIIREFSIMNLTPSGPHAKVQNLQWVLEHALSAAEKRGLEVTRDLLRFGAPSPTRVDFARYGFDREWLSEIPQCPGVYTFSDREGKVLYVGKSNNLKNRINSYFWSTGEGPPSTEGQKIEGILNDLYMIDCTELGSDLEALIEEYRLIDQHRPRYNTRVSIQKRTVTIPRRILIPRSLSKGMLKLYLLTEGLPLLEHEYWCGEKDRRLRDLLEEMSTGTGYVFDPLKTIALSYMKRYEDNLIIIDVDRYGTAQDVERVLRQHCEDMKRGETERSIYL